MQENITQENLQNKTFNLLNKVEEFNMTLSAYDVSIVADILKKSITINSTNIEVTFKKFKLKLKIPLKKDSNFLMFMAFFFINFLMDFFSRQIKSC